MTRTRFFLTAAPAYAVLYLAVTTALHVIRVAHRGQHPTAGLGAYLAVNIPAGILVSLFFAWRAWQVRERSARRPR